MTDTSSRPSHTTIAAGMVMGGSVLVVVGVGEQIAGINSLATRESVADFLARQGLDLGVPEALVLLRTALMVVAGCATASVILGYQVLKRSKPARLGLSVLAVPLFFGGLATGGFLTSLVAASAMWLWIDPSRAWLDRTPLPEPPSRHGTRPEAPRWPPPAPPPAEGEQKPPPHTGTFGAPPPAGPPAQEAAERRPDRLVWACVLTWAFGGVTLALLGASLTLMLTDPSLFWDQLERQNPGILEGTGVGREELMRTTTAIVVVGMLWAVAAMVLAGLAFRRVPGGRVGLVISAASAGVLCLVSSIGAVFMVVPAIACVATVLLLAQPDVRAWFATAPRRP